MFRRISFRAAGDQKTEKRAEGFAPGAKRLAGAGHHRTLGKEHGDRLWPPVRSGRQYAARSSYSDRLHRTPLYEAGGEL